VAIAEGAHFRGSVDMQRKGAAQPPQTAKPAAHTAPPVPQAVPPQGQVAAGQR
jgi:hypothetical protein